MMAVIGMMIFTGAMAIAVAAIWVSVAPQWRRIVRIAGGDVEQRFSPATTPVRADRRVVVRRWASLRAPTTVRHQHAA